jgi:acetoin utilization deacetylase AcuC-like enzyme
VFLWPELGPANAEPIEAVHGEEHVRRIANLAARGGGWVDPDTFVAPPSYRAALDAAWATVGATRDVLDGQVRNGLVLVRPPGHHATSNRAMGFCLFNNVAIAAEWALSQAGCQRVAILDVDVHHGNGTQEIFYRRSDVLYYSTHQFPFYPGTGAIDETGVGAGAGATINIPLGAGCGDETYLEATERVLTPALLRYRPELIFVSLGFDAHWVDPLAQMRLSLAGYGEILERIASLAAELCDGRLIFILEGGYDLRVLEAGLTSAGCILAGLPRPRDPLGMPPAAAEPPGASKLVDAVCRLHDLPPPIGG